MPFFNKYKQQHDDGGFSTMALEREFETGKDEAWAANMTLVFANMKRTYDEYQNESLTNVRENRAYVQKVLSDAQQNDNQRQTIANQALQNAVETANMVSKQTVRHNDLSVDRQWNIDEQAVAVDRTWNVDEVAQQVSKNAIFSDAIAAAVVAAVNVALAAKK